MILYDIVSSTKSAGRARLLPLDRHGSGDASCRPAPFSLEAKHAIRDFDMLAISLPYEQLFTNALNLLDLAGLPCILPTAAPATRWSLPGPRLL